MPCKKSKFATKEAADKWRQIVAKKRGQDISGSSYFCIECLSYHISKMVSVDDKEIKLLNTEIEKLKETISKLNDEIKVLRESSKTYTAEEVEKRANKKAKIISAKLESGKARVIIKQSKRIIELKKTVTNLAYQVYHIKPDAELCPLKGYSDEEYN